MVTLWPFSIIIIFAAKVSSHTSTGITDHFLSYSLPLSEEDWRQSLPSKLRDNKGAPLHRLVARSQAGNETVTIYLLGTSHVSRTSCLDAELLMEHVRPDCLFVELCSQRVGLMLPQPETIHDDGDETRTQIKQHVMPSLSANMFAKIQNDYASKLNVTIGGEFKTAFRSALRQQREFWNSRQQYQIKANNDIGHPRANRPCAIVLGDRPVRITLVRAWESLRFFGKMKLVLALLWSSIKQPSENELLEWMESVLNDRTGNNDLMRKAMNEMAKSFPSLKRVIIDERDDFMVAKLKQTAELLAYSSNNHGERVLVAVIGAAHCNGVMEKLLDTTLSQRPEEIFPTITRTKRTADDDFEGSEVVLFDYAYAIETGMI